MKKPTPLQSCLTGAIALLFSCAPLFAQDYPNRPIRMIIPFSPGGVADIVARLLGGKMNETVGQNVVMDNRAGAGGALAGDIVAKAKPDGYTLLLCSTSVLVINPLLSPASIPYDPVRDFAGITLVTASPYVLLVPPSSAATSVRDLIAMAKAAPRKLNYGSPGVGTTTHLVTEVFRSMAGIELTHVPYKGASLAAIDLLGDHLQLMFDSIAAALPNIKAGRLRALGISTLKRFALTPQIPTVSEAGVPGFQGTTWQGLCAPAATPKPVLATLNRAAVRAIRSPELTERFAELGAEGVGNTPAEFQTYLKEEIARWRKAIQDSGAKAQ